MNAQLSIKTRSLILALLVTTLFSSVAVAQPFDVPDADPAAAFKKDQVDTAINRAINFLISRQHRTGAITDRTHDTTMTALSMMAMAAVGHQPTDPTPYGRAMRKGLEFILREDRQHSSGYFGLADRSKMYGHGIITLTLAEMLGMGLDIEQDKLIRLRLKKAINLILQSQRVYKSYRFRGGWRYTPTARDADLSITIWQLMALRSAKNAGLDIPAKSIEDAVAYLKRSYYSRLHPDGTPVNKVSAFAYQPGGGPEYAMAAAGLLAMQVCGEYKSPLAKGAADWLSKRPPQWYQRWFFYGTYYYAQGMYQRGGEHAKTARTIVQSMLLKYQQRDGSWFAGNSSERSYGRVYATSLGVLSLAVKYHYLPIYQR